MEVAIHAELGQKIKPLSLLPKLETDDSAFYLQGFATRVCQANQKVAAGKKFGGNCKEAPPYLMRLEMECLVCVLKASGMMPI